MGKVAAGLILALALAVDWLHDSNTKLRQDLAATKAASALYKQQQQAKLKQVEREHEQTTNDINSRYNDILKRLHDYENRPVRTVTIAGECESERDSDSRRMQTELLRRLANVAKYADELKQRGLACETISSGL